MGLRIQMGRKGGLWLRAHFRASSLRALATAVPSAQMPSPHILVVFPVDHNMMVFFFFLISGLSSKVPCSLSVSLTSHL